MTRLGRLFRHSASSKQATLDTTRIPRHVAVIMDGNGRWAKARAMPRVAGHREGAKRARELVERAAELGIQTVTLYAFSSENWQRAPEEVQELMRLLEHYLTEETAYFAKQGARLTVIGDRSRLPDSIQSKLQQTEASTATNQRIHVQVALSYGGRQELLHATRQLCQQAIAQNISPDSLTEEDLGAALYTGQTPDPDLLIRTGGEQRVSNFLLWQIAYAELYFTDIYWPDFTADRLDEALRDYQTRERRFGRTEPETEAVA